ncbi:unnamed protein product [Hapterophycus canaliculatus]
MLTLMLVAKVVVVLVVARRTVTIRVVRGLVFLVLMLMPGRKLGLEATMSEEPRSSATSENGVGAEAVWRVLTKTPQVAQREAGEKSQRRQQQQQQQPRARRGRELGWKDSGCRTRMGSYFRTP